MGRFPHKTSSHHQALNQELKVSFGGAVAFTERETSTLKLGGAGKLDWKVSIFSDPVMTASCQLSISFSRLPLSLFDISYRVVVSRSHENDILREVVKRTVTILLPRRIQVVLEPD